MLRIYQKSLIYNFNNFIKFTYNTLQKFSTLNTNTLNSTLNSTNTTLNTTTSTTGTTTNGLYEENYEWRKRIIGGQTGNNLKVGPYKRGRWFVSYKEDRGSFITNILIILVTGYAIFTLLPGKIFNFSFDLGESMKVRRQRKLRQMLLDKANLTEAELDYIENYQFKSKQINTNPNKLITN
ncbi:uncharacterized protein TA09825 [Theileria annulata]|uniref:Transmembrane protein n=1 Tax=Theileria annulata TaxID=5874 RepID=Q4U8M9_THEAN|nr:uncharacterized protein TA09825 [Theileria annulata]CAI76824.1 hypothetical protein, conserved [Theileria annulata]|eukprot:XP_953449.1 hypothetical protein, conserved [Theileria annulata]